MDEQRRRAEELAYAMERAPMGSGGSAAAPSMSRLLQQGRVGQFAQPAMAPPDMLAPYRTQLSEQELLNAWRRSPGFGNLVLDVAKPGWRDERDRGDPTIGGIYPLPKAPY